jgi:1-deoxy-D-xylulose-5-phosphate synthase
VEAAEILLSQGVDCGVINMRFAKPLDTALIKEALKVSTNLVTVEDNVLTGGFGAGALEFISDENLKADVLRIGIKDIFVEHAKQSELYDDIGISGPKIAARILEKSEK